LKTGNGEPVKEFYFKGNNTGVLLIHGFTGTPSEMRLLGEYLAKKGYTVKGILLKGHEAAPETIRICSYWIGYMTLWKGIRS
jgi:esterase/lipase